MGLKKSNAAGWSTGVGLRWRASSCLLDWGRRRQWKAHQNREGTSSKGQKGETPFKASKESRPTGRVHSRQLPTRPGSPPPKQPGQRHDFQLQRLAEPTQQGHRLNRLWLSAVVISPSVLLQPLCIVESYWFSCLSQPVGKPPVLGQRTD